jgi:hypothetical protein
MCTGMVCIHYTKRVLEVCSTPPLLQPHIYSNPLTHTTQVLFVHSFTGSPTEDLRR